MLVYVAVIVVVVLMLVVSYRALAGGEVLEEDDYRAVIRSLAGFTGARAEELNAALVTSRPEGDGEDPLTVAATGMRKKLAGYQQQLSRFETGAAGGLDVARAQLSTAIEDLGWACRMIEPGTYRTNEGIRSAVATLRQHGVSELSGVHAILDAEPVPH